MNHRTCEGLLLQVQDVLHDVIAKGVDDELGGVAHNLGDDPVTVGRVGVVEAPLQHTAAVPVCGHRQALSRDAVVDAGCQVRRQSSQAALDHVVGVHVADELH
eukprot:scaffold473_cov104-Isochrysis_galbana.AAC.1